ncbi:unnamed protein product (macronuclear) [Paramecium tetraurelia]|uniref:Transmembrane protein n=1 Tax=Paramecium tetraurelia TaxID=5888 RepID=A0BL96_PARTE|nr:uncharacterized protein GSPATT00029945001 [Paramecium tetraurelia]CAK59313.1 unnamed protein product [Paramecium tetraurelia]|eukprot:XP_001426711.1 hypothetical protein (macronuclear) [Paramecium tetraurelia strain d4-2]
MNITDFRTVSILCNQIPEFIIEFQILGATVFIKMLCYLKVWIDLNLFQACKSLKGILYIQYKQWCIFNYINIKNIYICSISLIQQTLHKQEH